MTQAETGMVILARRVRDLRKAAGMTQTELGSRMTALGQEWSRTTVAKLEAGRRESVSPDEWWALALVFEVPPVWLLADLVTGTPVQIGNGIEIDPASALLWMTGRQPLDTEPGPAWDGAARPVAQVYELAVFLQKFREMGGYRELSALVFYENGDRVTPQHEVDEAYARVLRSIATRLRNIRDCGLSLPPLPADVTDRARELGVDLPGQEG